MTIAILRAARERNLTNVLKWQNNSPVPNVIRPSRKGQNKKQVLQGKPEVIKIRNDFSNEANSQSEPSSSEMDDSQVLAVFR